MGYETPGNESLPQLYTDCFFGKWYYGEGQFISNISGYKEIEQGHIDLHNIYMQIYKTYQDPAEKGFWESQGSADRKKDKELADLVKKLKTTFEIMIQRITDIENAIVATDD